MNKLSLSPKDYSRAININHLNLKTSSINTIALDIRFKSKTLLECV
ncbi:hypothetical protein ES705_25334 [subsurface metagenome]